MSEGNDRLFNALAEYLRAPLLEIARGAELVHALDNGSALKTLAEIELTAGGALRMIDSFLLAYKSGNQQIDLRLEPVAIQSVLYDSAETLGQLAKTYGCELKVDCQSRQAPVMANRIGLKAALTSLGQVLVESAPSKKKKPVLTLASYSDHGRVTTGVFTGIENLSNQMLERSRGLLGRASVPLAAVAANSAVGVFIADSLFNGMSSRLRVARHGEQNGLAATLLTSQQLNLV